MRWCFFIMLLLGGKCFAAEILPSIPKMYRQVAAERQVPAKLFFALALQESRKVSGRRILPWPWTVNHRGKPYYFDTKGGAYRLITKLIRKGDMQFDVGLGQLNWRWHGHKFKGPSEALNPYTNLTAAAMYLREQYESHRCTGASRSNDEKWKLAVGCYHRPGQKKKDKKIAAHYASGVVSLWKRI